VKHYLVCTDVQLAMKVFDLELQLPDLTAQSLDVTVSDIQLHHDETDTKPSLCSISICTTTTV